jgi:hypothetical protein
MNDGANRFPAFPCFRIITLTETVKQCGKKSFVFIILLEVQPLACGQDEANSQGKRMG